MYERGKQKEKLIAREEDSKEKIEYTNEKKNKEALFQIEKRYSNENENKIQIVIQLYYYHIESNRKRKLKRQFPY